MVDESLCNGPMWASAPTSARGARSEAERAEGGTSGTLVTEILGAPQREIGKEELVKCILATRCRRYPRRGNPPSNLHRTPPRPSETHRKPAGTISRRPSYLSKLARTCKFALNIFSFPPGAAHFLFDVSIWGPRRAPRGGERRSAQAHGVGAEVPLGCKGAGAVFAAGGNGA